MWNSNTFVLGGVGRSGTTITGKLIGSFKGVEYFYEPAILNYLFNVVNEYQDQQEWSRLFRQAAYYDLLKNSIAGRNINLNPYDDSYILNYKSREEIAEKHGQTFGQKEIVEKASERTLAFKILENIKNISQIRESEPDIKSLIIIRNPVDVLDSLLNKGWFSDKDLDLRSPDPARHYRPYKGYRVMDFVEEGDEDHWLQMEETKRYAYYYQKSYEAFFKIKNSPNTWFLSYDEMIANPKGTVDAILNHCNFEVGDKTNEIIESIAKTKSSKFEVFNQLDDKTKQIVTELHQTLNKSALNT